MTGTVAASLGVVALFLLLIRGAAAGFGASGLPPRARVPVAAAIGLLFPNVVYLVVRLVDNLAPLEPLTAYFDARRPAGTWLTLSAVAVGFTLFMGGVLHLLLTSGRSESFTLPEMARALRRGRWLRSTVWRRRVAVTAGVALFTCGLLGFFLVVGPPGVKLFLVSCALYAAGAAVGAARRRAGDGRRSGVPR